MIDIRPFRALRPSAPFTAAISSPPWDVLTAEEVTEYTTDNAHNLLHVTRPEVVSPDSDPFQYGRQKLNELIQNRILILDNKEAFYIYQIQKENHIQTGLFAAVSCQDYLDGKILLHEHTLRKKEDDRAELIAAHGACAEPVFYFCQDHPELDQFYENHISQDEADVSLVDEANTKHQLWVLDQTQQIESIHQYFSEMPHLYVADGHHRSAGGARYFEKRKKEHGGSVPPQAPWSHMLAAIFTESQVNILGYHRVVRDLGNSSSEDFLEKLNANFQITSTDQPNPPLGSVDFYLNKAWYRLQLNPIDSSKSSDSSQTIDAARLQDQILGPHLGIEDPREDPRVDFIGGDHAEEKLMARCDDKDWAIAFYLHGVPAQQLRAVAEAGGVMPPKSTWFDPKLRSGLVILPLENMTDGASK